MANKQFDLKIINQKGIVYFGNCNVLFVPTENDTVAIMAYHEPILMRLSAGKISVREGHSHSHITDIKHGVLYVGENEVTVLCS